MNTYKISLKCNASGKAYFEFNSLPGMRDKIAKVLSSALVVKLDENDVVSKLSEMGISATNIDMIIKSVTLLDEVSFHGDQL